MIRKIKNSLTVKICILIAVLLLIISGITCGMVARFLPPYYSSQLEKNLDIISQGMVETIRSYDSLEEASNAIALFEAGSQVSVTILGEEGNVVWPAEPTLSGGEIGTPDGYVGSVYIDDGYISYNVYDAGEIDSEKVMENEITIVWEEADLEVNTSFAVKHYELKVGGKSYMMMVSGGMQPVDQAMEILREIFPYIIGIVLVISLIFALAASLYLTAPVVRLSRISERMAALDFADRYQGKRRDEIGVLGANLNVLSDNLSKTLGELQNVNEKLKSDIELERELERKRIAFFSAVSHELKTPITILKGHLSGMLQGIGEYKNRDYYLQRSSETADKMESLVQELLTVSRIESSSFSMQETDIAELLRQQIADFAELIEEKNLELDVELPDYLYAAVNPPMLEKVFANLLLNAIRYTPSGGENQIRISLAESELGAEHLQVHSFSFHIENTGTSIPDASLPHLFEAFYRVEQSRSRQTGGTGLGLYIVKMILEQHGADYSIRNTEEGVYFSFSL